MFTIEDRKYFLQKRKKKKKKKEKKLSWVICFIERGLGLKFTQTDSTEIILL